MKTLKDEIVQFFHSQGFVIVSTVDKDGRVHNSCKGLVKIDKAGSIYLLDLYKGATYNNLTRNPSVSITAVDEHRFRGFCLKGKAKLLKRKELEPEIAALWEKKITDRATHRVIKNIKGEKGHPRHPEVLLPVPEYMIVVEIEQVVDLTPQHLRNQG